MTCSPPPRNPTRALRVCVGCLQTAEWFGPGRIVGSVTVVGEGTPAISPARHRAHGAMSGLATFAAAPAEARPATAAYVARDHEQRPLRPTLRHTLGCHAAGICRRRACATATGACSLTAATWSRLQPSVGRPGPREEGSGPRPVRPRSRGQLDARDHRRPIGQVRRAPGRARLRRGQESAWSQASCRGGQQRAPSGRAGLTTADVRAWRARRHGTAGSCWSSGWCGCVPGSGRSWLAAAAKPASSTPYR